MKTRLIFGLVIAGAVPIGVWATWQRSPSPVTTKSGTNERRTPPERAEMPAAMRDPKTYCENRLREIKAVPEAWENPET